MLDLLLDRGSQDLDQLDLLLGEFSTATAELDLIFNPREQQLPIHILPLRSAECIGHPNVRNGAVYGYAYAVPRARL